jgi:hypothetical protein
MAEETKDATATVFGWVIAFILPGLLTLYAIALWFSAIAAQLMAFSEAESTIGLFLIVVLTCLLVGIELSALRWLLFERWICRKHRLVNSEFVQLRSPEKHAAFKSIVDEHYKYHQCYGGLALVIPFFSVSLAHCYQVSFFSWIGAWSFLGTVLVEALTVAGAIDSYKKYVGRAKALLIEEGQ